MHWRFRVRIGSFVFVIVFDGSVGSVVAVSIAIWGERTLRFGLALRTLRYGLALRTLRFGLALAPIVNIFAQIIFIDEHVDKIDNFSPILFKLQS